MTFSLLLDGEAHEIAIVRRRPHLVVRIDGREHVVSDTGGAGPGLHRIAIDGEAIAIARAADRDRQFIRLHGRSHVATPGREGAEEADGGRHAELRAPMPGAVVAIHAAPGDAVTAGQPLVTIESMKLQAALGAPRDGVVAEVAVAEGQVFDRDQLLLRLRDDEGPADA